MALGKSDRHDMAMQAFDQALALNPDCAAAWYSEGPVFRFACQLENRITGVSRRSPINPDSVKEYKTRAFDLLRSDLFEDAVRAYDEEIGQDRPSALHWYNRVRHLMRWDGTWMRSFPTPMRSTSIPV